MDLKRTKKWVQVLLSEAGITLNGKNSADIHVYNENFYASVLKDPILGLGESYVAKWWDCERLDKFFNYLLRANLAEKIKKDKHFLYYMFRSQLRSLFMSVWNLQAESRAFEVGRRHYDQGNALYQAMLDKNLNYSCGYWKGCSNLDEAQQAKLALVCEKLQLKPGMHVLDIGCGWGSFCRYAAENHGVSVLGVTVSKEQYRYAKDFCKGFPVEICLLDYRAIKGSFDSICSIGMFEHVGPKNYHSYMKIAYHCLKKGGLFLLHTIGSNKSQHHPNLWIHKYIFPNGVLPSIKQIGKASESFFVMEDWHNFGVYYDQTLMAWYANFAKNWNSLQPFYDEPFYRMWKYYLLACAGAFRARDIQLWQIIFSKGGVVCGYDSIR
ncbi:MAG: cyclopropane fatty acyl phospholipid synthase [Rickettsiella sp.]|nr:cyclopropane fatty acyl phospholipid synthase [Rickettsiella sp.]